MIPYNKPCLSGREKAYLEQCLAAPKISGDGEFTKRCHAWFKSKLDTPYSLLTTSASSALDMAALLVDIKPGDEVIMPSFNFVSAANSFVIRGAKIRFVDIDPVTMNVQKENIEPAITPKTKAIVVVHYAGVSCDMDPILQLAKKHSLVVIEDAAQGFMSSYKGRALGTIGDYGCYSFHDTKNITSGGEGGLFIAKDRANFERAEIIREKGTNRNLFLKGVVDKYTWVGVGSSFLPSELNAAYLLGSLEMAREITEHRLALWNYYLDNLSDLFKKNEIQLPVIPSYSKHNGHIFFFKLPSESIRDSFIHHMKNNEITTPFHYIPLHSAPAGQTHGSFVGEDKYTTLESSKLVRLPLYHAMTHADQDRVIETIRGFFSR